MENKLNILKQGDQNGWIYNFLADEQKRYSRHNILYHAFKDPEPINLDGIDLLYVHSPDINHFVCDELLVMAKERNIPFINGYGGFVQNRYKYTEVVSTISPQTFRLAKESYPDAPVIFLPESVDDQFFTPKTDYSEFTCGFLGRPCEIKRYHLLDQLKYPIKRQIDWGKEFFKRGRTLEPSRDFLHSIDCLVVLSKSEAMPHSVLEALACGLPVVSTNVGSIEMLLDKEWIVPSFVEPGESLFHRSNNIKNEMALVDEVNKKLDLLANNSELRRIVGQRNREHVEKYFSWAVNTKYWDTIFECVVNKDYDYMMEVSKQSMHKWSHLFK